MNLPPIIFPGDMRGIAVFKGPHSRNVSLTALSK
jgi:hypothetical protein